jgi:uncharacterized protein (TIGR00725 family)
MNQQQLIGVIGAGTCDEETALMAYQVGKRIAEAGCGLVCGGLGGVMEGACKGARDAGGITVGVLPGDLPLEANPFVAIRIATGMGIARNAIIVRSSAAVIAIAGGAGTLSEISFCVKLGVPVVGLRSFDVFPEIIQVQTAAEAVTAALARLR